MFLLQLLLQGPIQFSQKSCLGVYHGPSPARVPNEDRAMYDGHDIITGTGSLSIVG